MADVNHKSLLDFSNDLVRSYNLLARLSARKDLILDSEAYNELLVARLIISNRMAALGIAGGRSVPQIKETEYFFDELIKDLQVSADIKETVIREKNLRLQMLSGDSFEMVNTLSNSTLVNWADELYRGLGMCIYGNQQGAEAIKSSLHKFSSARAQLIYLVSRNIDHPLIAVAAKGEGSVCAAAVDDVVNFIGGKVKPVL